MKTLEMQAEHEAFQQRVLEQIGPLFNAQLSAAKGLNYVFRVEIGYRGGRADPILVTDPEEIAAAIAAIDPGKGYGEIIVTRPAEPDDQDDVEEGEEPEDVVISRRYYSITTKAPDTKAIDSLIDRAFGKAVTRVAGPDGGPIRVVGITVNFKKKE